MELQKQQILQVKNFYLRKLNLKLVGDRASEVGVSTAIGVGADLIAPPVGKAVGAGLRAVTPKKFVSLSANNN